jgi:hypothetical protein
MKRVMMAVVLAVVSPVITLAQAPEARIEAAKARTAERGLPVSLLEDRVNEGRAKGVPLDRIAEAVERRETALAAAGEALRPTAPSISSAELAAGADAIEAGIPAEALRAVVAGARSEDRPVALAVLTYLHREEGLPVDRALERVAQAMARGPDALRDLPAQARSARDRAPGRADPPGVGRRGEPPPAAGPNPGNRPGAGRPNSGRPETGRPDDGRPGNGRPPNPGRPDRS